MAQQTNILKITLDGSGTEIPALNISDGYDSYLITGVAISTGNYAIVPRGTPQFGDKFVFRYNGTLDITSNGNTFSLFGQPITQAQLLKYWEATCTYNGSGWNVILQLSLGDSGVISSSNIGTGTIVNSNIANNTIDISQKAVDLSVTTSKINNLAVTTSKINDLAVTDSKIANVNGSKIVDGTVTNNKLANVPAYSVIGNNTGSPSTPSYITIPLLINSNAWSLTGNSGTNPATNFIGTTDAADLVFKINNIESGRISVSLYNTSYGTNTLTSITIGTSNTAIGLVSQRYTTSGEYNTSVGAGSLSNNTTGSYNTAIGPSAGNVNVSGSYNTYIGAGANSPLLGGTSAQHRIALGANAEATADYQFAIPADVTHINFPLNAHTQGALLTSDGSGIGTWNVPSINTTAGNSATINAISGRFRKDTSGATFTLTNSFITPNSIILLTMVQLDATATRATVVAGSGSAVITFDAAPTSNLDVNFLIMN